MKSFMTHSRGRPFDVAHGPELVEGLCHMTDLFVRFVQFVSPPAVLSSLSFQSSVFSSGSTVLRALRELRGEVVSARYGFGNRQIAALGRNSISRLSASSSALARNDGLYVARLPHGHQSKRFLSCSSCFSRVASRSSRTSR